MNDKDCNLVVKKFFFGNSLLTSSLSFNSNSNGNLSPSNNFPIISLFSISLVLKPDSTLFRPASLLRNYATSIMLQLLRNHNEIITEIGFIFTTKLFLKVFLSKKTLPDM